MRAAGIIAEYNPFHSGHAYQITCAREAAHADAVIVAMSGAFTQRGEPALIDKWTRARMAVMNGADIVIELPCLFALREAQGFAEGGVALLSGLGIVDALSFGCEVECIEYIEPVARCLADEPDEYRALLREGLDAGMSYPRARAQAASRLLDIPQALMDSPNFALALEYAQANARRGHPLELKPIARTSDFHATALAEICSASAIRAAVARGEGAAALYSVPENCRALFAQALGLSGKSDAPDPDAPCAITGDAFLSDLALLALRGLSPDELCGFPGVSEGLEHLMCRQARMCSSADELLTACKSRRYTYSRLRRLLPQIVLGITRETQSANPLPTYARVLACRRSALSLLGEIKRRGALPLATNPKALDGDPIWALETRATDLWGLLTQSPICRRAGRDYTHRFVIVD